MSTLILLNKPYGYLSQFTPEGRWKGLRDLIPVPNVYVAGRLDADSEGLLLLTDNGQLQSQITQPKHKPEKTYWVQVEGEPSTEALERMAAGIRYADFDTLPCEVRQIPPPEALWPRNPPVRFRKTIPTSWLEIHLHEGKNRQIRRMTAYLGFPTLRLIRYAIGQITLANLAPGEWCYFTGSPTALMTHHAVNQRK